MMRFLFEKTNAADPKDEPIPDIPEVGHDHIRKERGEPTP
jgi:hypothetical protein